MKIALLILVFALSGCVTRYVSIPDSMTQHCVVAEPTTQTLDEAVKVANDRKASLDQCNQKLDRIHKIQGSVVKMFP